jgi:hypothetical protein
MVEEKAITGFLPSLSRSMARSATASAFRGEKHLVDDHKYFGEIIYVINSGNFGSSSGNGTFTIRSKCFIKSLTMWLM